MHIPASHDQAIIAPTPLLRAFVLQIKGQRKNAILHCRRELAQLLCRRVGKMHCPVRGIGRIFHAQNISIFYMLSTKISNV